MIRHIAARDVEEAVTERSTRRRSLLAESMRAHTLNFERRLAPAYAPGAGTRMLAAFLLVAVVAFIALRYLATAVGTRGLPAANFAFVIALLAAFVVAQRSLVRVPMSAIGLHPFADWGPRERLYFLQVVPLAVLIFAFVFRNHLLALLAKHGPVGFVLFSVLTGLLWGMVQEFLYRGWLQTELTRRLGVVAGLLLANAAFTFGPLHLNYLFDPEGVRWSALLAVFGIGAFFGLLYYRSGNLWIPAVLHGLWPPNMT